MTPTNGRTPRTGERQLRVQFANGLVSRWTYVARQLRFSKTGSEWDIVAVERVQ